MSSIRIPIATYRLQFNRSLRFSDAKALVPYLRELGITDLYSSPLLKARSGSSHGYDTVDPLSLNAELGTKNEFDGLVLELKRNGMGLLLDIVPNHMAASPENQWWTDVLENGPSSPHASYFDIDWHPAGAKGVLENVILLPILGEPYGDVLEKGEFTLTLEENGFLVSYYEVRFPLDPSTYGAILSQCRTRLRNAVPAGHPSIRELDHLIQATKRLPGRDVTDPKDVRARYRRKEIVKHTLWNLYNNCDHVKRALDQTLKKFNGKKVDPSSFDSLDQLLSQQPYRLAFWRTATEAINYRRFFDISDLIGIRMEDAHVFRATHALIFRLIKEGKVTGLRIDHIDGLSDPLEYLRRLQAYAASDPEGREAASVLYVVVEKILAEGELVPEDWPVHGTTGYDFLNTLSGVFVERRGLRDLERIYGRFVGFGRAFGDVSYLCKKQVMEEFFAGEVDALGHHLFQLAAWDRHARDIPPTEFVEALAEVTASLPVYRTYVRSFEVTERDLTYMEHAFTSACERTPEERVSPAAFAFLRRVLTLNPPDYGQDAKGDWLHFLMRWQQFTGRVMAKGVEDTALYVHNPLVSLNEVGADPQVVEKPVGVEGLHRRNRLMLRRWPYTFNASSTHDTKRSEDVRARINVLSEIPTEWEKRLVRWSRWNRPKKLRVGGHGVPDNRMEILLYQTLVGAWPLQAAEVTEFRERVKVFLVKAAREAKDQTSWLYPNDAYESALGSFVDAILEDSTTNRFLDDFRRFQSKIAYCGAFNSLAQILLKVASPGAPDFYQGTELWDFSLVDPDNRRPVDFAKRVKLLQELKRAEARDATSLPGELIGNWEDGRVKLYLTWKALGFRRSHSELFLEGDYVPLRAVGSRQGHICAFARHRRGAWALVAVPIKITQPGPFGSLPLGRRVWEGTSLVLPARAPERWRNVLTGGVLNTSPEAGKIVLRVSIVFRSFPIALLSEVSA